MREESNPISARRQANGLTQEEAARKGSVSISTWRAWEQSRAVPHRKRYTDIAAALDWTIADVANAVAELEQQMLRKEHAA